MLKYYGFSVESKDFPDGTPLLRIKADDYWRYGGTKTIFWKYESMQELTTIRFVADYLKENGFSFRLIMPYLPNARMDRVKNDDEVFTLKYFAKEINNMGFESVTVVDPHSSVSAALIDRIIVVTVGGYIEKAYSSVMEIEGKEPMIVFPDEGAMKRYCDLLPKSDILSCVFGVKHRDWETGNILGVQIIGDIEYDRPVLIIDDICSYGGTFYHVGNKLKEMGLDENIYLYITHCENSILKGKLFEENVIAGVFTTDSLFSAENDRIKIFNIEGELL